MNEPALYREGHTLARRSVQAVCNEFSDKIARMSGRCLDIGSGPGDAVVDFVLPKLNRKASLVCSDISEKMVNFGRDKYKDNHRISFIKLDIESANLPTELVNQFNHVTSFYCLNWCQDTRQAFQNIFDVLRPEGTALLVFVAKGPIYDAWKAMEAVPQYEPYMKNADRYISNYHNCETPREAVRTLIEDTGFEVHHCSVRELSHIFDGPVSISKYVLGVDPFLDNIPAHLLDEYKKDVVEEYAKQNITFKGKNDNEDNYSSLSLYDMFVMYIQKPFIH